MSAKKSAETDRAADNRAISGRQGMSPVAGSGHRRRILDADGTGFVTRTTEAEQLRWLVHFDDAVRVLFAALALVAACSGTEAGTGDGEGGSANPSIGMAGSAGGRPRGGPARP